jgi:hypothetical protein
MIRLEKFIYVFNSEYTLTIFGFVIYSYRIYIQDPKKGGWKSYTVMKQEYDASLIAKVVQDEMVKAVRDTDIIT